MMTTKIHGTTLRARTPHALFLKVARALGGRTYVSRLDSWTEDGAERVYEITATTPLRGQRCSEVHGRAFVTVRDAAAI